MKNQMIKHMQLLQIIKRVLRIHHQINKEFKNTEVIGLYYQKLLHKKPNINDKEPLENLKLIGYTIDSEELISKIDSSYEDSTVIKGMKNQNY